MEKILITGANGFLGSHLVRHLFRLGYTVRAMVRQNASLSGLEAIPCELFFGNIDNQEQVEQAVQGCDWVVHAAALTDQWAVQQDVYDRINVKATKFIAEACIKLSVKKLVFVGTANAFGPGTLKDPGTELNGFNLFQASSPYINTKYLAQQYLLEMAEACNLPVVLVNPSFMIGPHDYKPSSGTLVLHAMRNRVLFYPPGGKNFVAVHDVCNGIVQALQVGRTGQCYLLTGENMSYRQFFKLVQKESGHRTILIGLPSLIIRTMGWLSPFFRYVFGERWRLNRSVAYMATQGAYYSGSKAREEWGLQPSSITNTIKDTVEWFRVYKNLL